MKSNFCKAALIASAFMLLPGFGWAQQVTSSPAYGGGESVSFHNNSFFAGTASDVIPSEPAKEPSMQRTPPAKPAQAASAKAKSAFTCQGLYAKRYSVKGFNSTLEYACAYEAFRDHSIVLIDQDKMHQFVDAWAPDKWFNGVLLKMDGVSDAERTLNTFVLISRMRDFTHERFDFVESPKERSEQDKTLKAPVIEGGAIGARLILNAEWELKKAIFDGAPEKGLTPDAFDARRQALFIIGAGHELSVESAMPDGPAEGVLQEGDIISAVGDTKLDGMHEEDAISLIRGELGTSVTLHVLRLNSKGVALPLTFTMVRSKVRESAVAVHDLGGIRYIELANFTNDDLLTDFYKALEGAQEKSMTGVSISVRGNPGGRLDYVLAMLDMIIPRGLVLRSAERISESSQIKQTEYIDQDGFRLITEKVEGVGDGSKKIEAAERVPFTAEYAAAAMKNPGYVYTHPLLPVIDEHMPVAVLINVGSYSASEIFAGAIQGTGRGAIVGEPSAGKGAIMADMPLPEGGSLAVTFGEFFPGGIKNKGPGILPDYEVENAKDFGQTDAQADKARALIAAAHEAMTRRTTEGAERTKINGARFEDDMRRRDQFDMKDPKEQQRLSDQ